MFGNQIQKFQIEKNTNNKKLKKGKIPINVKIDFHGMAYNDAKDKLKKKTSEEIAKVTGMPNMPFDIKLPF